MIGSRKSSHPNPPNKSRSKSKGPIELCGFIPRLNKILDKLSISMGDRRNEEAFHDVVTSFRELFANECRCLQVRDH